MMFNLFRQKDEPTIVCALRDGAALPSFLRDRAWEYDGKVDEIESELPGFDGAAAEAVIDTAGYYIFTMH